MSLYDSLMESVIYEDSVEEYKERIEILKEFHYSKEELQDPDILKKILQKTKQDNEKYKTVNEKLVSISFLLSICIGIITGIIAGSFALSLAAFSGFFLSVFYLIDGILNKVYYSNENLDKNINEIQIKVEKLKKSAQKIKDKEESKKIIDNCDKILNSIDKYHKNKDKKVEKKLDNYINKPYFETDMGGEFTHILEYLRDVKKIPASQVRDTLINNYKSLDYDNAWDLMYGRDSENDKKEYASLYKKYLSLADNNQKVYVYTNNDDNFDFVSPVTKKLYTITTDDTIEVISGDLYKRYILN